jgi:hypothetical protein
MSMGRDERREQCGVRRRRTVIVENNSKVLLEDVRQTLMKKSQKRITMSSERVTPTLYPSFFSLSLPYAFFRP